MRAIIKPFVATVGNPTPELHWKAHGRPIPENKRIRQLPDGSLQIVSVKNADTGNYTCMVSNKFGQHMITHELLVNGPPAPPSVLLTSQTTNSVILKLKQKNDKTPIHGFMLHYKPEFGDWDVAQIPYGRDEFTLDELLCGQRYNLYVTAYNE